MRDIKDTNIDLITCLTNLSLAMKGAKAKRETMKMVSRIMALEESDYRSYNKTTTNEGGYDNGLKNAPGREVFRPYANKRISGEKMVSSS